MTEALALKKFAEEECPWGQHIGIYRVGETRSAKIAGGAPYALGTSSYALGASGAVTTTDC